MNFQEYINALQKLPDNWKSLLLGEIMVIGNDGHGKIGKDGKRTVTVMSLGGIAGKSLCFDSGEWEELDGF